MASNPLPAQLSYRKFHPLEVVSRYRDPQTQVGENHSNLLKFKPQIWSCLCLNTHFVASELKDPICHSECQIGSFSSEATISFSITVI